MTLDEYARHALADALRPKYELLEPIGRGGMAVVFLANEVALSRVVAVKLLRPELSDDAFRLRFAREGRAAAAISHPNVVQVYTVGEVSGDPPIPYIIMQYIEGTSLDTILREHGRLPERRARRLLRDLAMGLAAAHERDLVHRDVKPANVLIERASGRAFVSDFGISAALSVRAVGGEPLGESGLVVGTPPYMSPEQALGEPVGTASDIYSFGIVAYETLTGTRPLEARSMQGWIAAHQLATPTPLLDRRPGVSTDLAGLVARCLAKGSTDRPSAADVAREVLPSSDHEILWPPPGLVDLPRLGRQLRRSAVALLGASLVLTTALATNVRGVYTGAGWWNGWASGPIVAASAAAEPSAGLVIGWRALVVAAAAAVSLALCTFGWYGLRRRASERSARARGWKPETIVDSLSDPDGRTGLLLSGSGEFATMSSESRHRTRRFRRSAAALVVASGAWCALTWCAWSASVLFGVPWQQRGGSPVGPGEALTLVGPALAGVLLAGAMLARERRTVGGRWRRAHSGTYAVAHVSEDEEVTAWYTELSGGAPVPTRRASPSRTRTALECAAGGAAVLWTVTGLAALVTAVVVSSGAAMALGPDAARVAAFLGREHRGALAEAEQALGDYRGFAAHTTSIDSSPRATRMRILSSLESYPIEPRLTLGSRGGFSTAALAADAVRRARSLSTDTLRLLTSVAEHPRTLLFRQLSLQSNPLAGEIPAPALREAMEANAAAAVVDAGAGRFDDADARLIENAIVSDAASRAANQAWSETGLRMLQSLAVLPLAEVARLRGDLARATRLHVIAVRLGEEIDGFGPSWVRGAIGLASDPRDLSALRAAVSDTTVPRGFLRAALEASGHGVCLNPREWLAGADPARVALLRDTSLVAESFRSGGIRLVFARFRDCTALSDG